MKRNRKDATRDSRGDSRDDSQGESRADSQKETKKSLPVRLRASGTRLSWLPIFAVAVLAWGVVTALPNALSEDGRNALPGWLPNQGVSLGLDLSGGSHLLLEADFAPVFAETFESLLSESRRALREAGVEVETLDLLKVADPTDGAVVITFSESTDLAAATRVLREVAGVTYEVSLNGREARLSLDPLALRDERRRILRQALEIIRRRLDETGTREPTVRLQGEDRILVQIPGLRDPERVKALLGRTARLTFHMTDESGGGAEAAPGFVRTAHREGGVVDVSRRIFVSGEHLTNAQATFQDGRPVVAFAFDGPGARRFGEVTTENVGRPFAVVLDGEVITAPVIQEPITGGSGIITGRFTTEEAQDMALLLRAGALPAPLTIVEERSVGPGLGADSVRAGTAASIVALLVVMVAMVALYGLYGVFADLALLANLLLILAVLSGVQATLTLPGIAGIVLTLGMAVDANVLIFERIREEASESRSVMGTLQAGYRRAFGTIIDANLTTFAAALMLYIFGTGPVRGFGVTLMIGLATSMFSALVLTRGMTSWSVKRTGALPSWTIPTYRSASVAEEAK